jgi:uncharacterized membrane protein
MEGLIRPTHLLFLSLILLLLYLVLRSLLRPRRSDDRRQASPSAEDIVRERYARGEINRPQFEQMMDDLRKGASRS